MLSLDNMYSGREHPGMANMPPSSAYNPAGFGGMQAYGMPPAYYGNPEQHMYPGEHNGNGVHVTGVERVDLENPVTPPPQRERFSYTRYQLELLNGIYIQIRYPNSMQKQLVAKRVGITREQVKIWFQNRRRKDITGKGNKSKVKREEFEDADNKQQMVPEHIMKIIIQELLKYENDPKGKKLRAKMQETKKKTPYDRPSRTKQESPIPSPPEIMPSHLDPNENYSPLQGFHTEAPPRANGANTSVGSAATLSPHSLISSTDSHSPGSYTEQRVSPQQEHGKKNILNVPSNEQLDMPAPPNAVAPPSGELDDKLSATFNPVPVPMAHTSQPSEVRSNPTSPNQNSQDGLHHDNKNVQYQWQQNVYPEGLLQDFSMTTFKDQMAPNGVPVTTHSPYGHPLSYGQYTTANTAVSTSDVSSAKSQLSPEQQKSMERVFPFPLMAEPPMVLSGLPPYPDAYGAAAKCPTTSGVYRDPYQPIMISSFNNPYYGQYDNAQVSAYQTGQKFSNL